PSSFLLLFSVHIPRHPRSTLFPYTTLFRSRPPDPSSARLSGRMVPLVPLIESIDGPVRPRDSRFRPRPRRGGDRDAGRIHRAGTDRKSTRLNSSHVKISYAVFCLKKKKKKV